ncbi:MAG: TIGR03619 family F420-dependent LLM class oxidoreductase [Myxococcota bacterium]
MRFTYTETMCDPNFLVPLAQEAEAAGFDSFAVPDSICYPQESDSKYPYNADGSREFLDGKPILDPFTLIPAMAAVTTRLRFSTFVVKLPVRGCVLVAKQAASVAVLCQNRFSFGVGVSPWPDDFRILGVPWEKRGKRMDEMIDIVRGLTTGEFFGYDGEIHQLEPVKISPVPSQPIPILVGGHSRPALRRAVTKGDGWMHAGGDPAELSKMLAQIQELRVEHGKQNDPFEIHIISMDAFTPDGVKRLEDIGVTDVIVGFRNSYANDADSQSFDDKVGNLRAYADSVIAKIR